MSFQPQQHHLALDAEALRESLDAHQRYLAGRSGGRRLNLPYADLSNYSLEGLNLRDADMTGACLRGANLAGANLAGSDLREGRIALQDKLDGFDILRHEHRPGELNYAVLSGTNLAGVQMSGAVAMTSDFTDANLSGAIMIGAKLTRAVLDGADL